MVLNPNGIGFVVAGGGFYSYLNLQCIKLDKEKMQENKKVLCIQIFSDNPFSENLGPFLS